MTVFSNRTINLYRVRSKRIFTLFLELLEDRSAPTGIFESFLFAGSESHFTEESQHQTSRDLPRDRIIITDTITENEEEEPGLTIVPVIDLETNIQSGTTIRERTEVQPGEIPGEELVESITPVLDTTILDTDPLAPTLTSPDTSTTISSGVLLPEEFNGGHALIAVMPPNSGAPSTNGGSSDSSNQEAETPVVPGGDEQPQWDPAINDPAQNTDNNDTGTIVGEDYVYQANADGTADQFTISIQDGNVELTDDSGTILSSIPLNGMHSFTIQGSADGEHLVVDFSNGDPVPSGGLFFHGNGPTTLPGDALTIQGGVQSVKYQLTEPASGVYTINNSSNIHFTGLEPTFINGPVDDVVIDIGSVKTAPGAVTATLDATDIGDILEMDVDNIVSFSGGFESIIFANPANSLTIIGDDADTDTILIDGLDPGFGNSETSESVDFLITGQTGDSVNINTNLRFTGSMQMNVPTITLDGTISVLDDNFQPQLSGNADLVNVTDSNSRIDNALDLVRGAGTITLGSDTYVDPVTIDKSVTLTGSTNVAADVILSPSEGNGITISPDQPTDNVTIANLSTRNAFDGIQAIGPMDTLQIDNVDNSNNFGYGLTVTNVLTVDISNSTFLQNQMDGLLLDSVASDVLLDHVSADDNSNNGMTITNAANTEISGTSSFSRNGNDGLSISNSGSVMLTDVVVNENDSDETNGGDGIDLANVGDVTFMNVTANNNDPGAIIDGADTFTDTNGTYSGNVGHGLVLTNITNSVALQGTELSKNGMDGANISYVMSGILSLSEIQAFLNGSDGVEIIDSGIFVEVQSVDSTYDDNSEIGLNISQAEDLFNPPAFVFLSGNTFDSNAIGLQLTDFLFVEFGVDNEFINDADSETGLKIVGQEVTIINESLSSSSFVAESGNFVSLVDGALSETNGSRIAVDASDSMFNGVRGNDMPESQIAMAENQITDYLDDASLGFVAVQSQWAYLPGQTGNSHNNLILVGSSDRDIINLNSDDPSAVAFDFGDSNSPQSGVDLSNGEEVVLFAMNGSDLIQNTGPVVTLLFAGGGSDRVYAGISNSIYYGQDGNDLFRAGPGSESFFGGEPVEASGIDGDYLIGAQEDDYFEGIEVEI